MVDQDKCYGVSICIVLWLNVSSWLIQVKNLIGKLRTDFILIDIINPWIHESIIRMYETRLWMYVHDGCMNDLRWRWAWKPTKAPAPKPNVKPDDESYCSDNTDND